MPDNREVFEALIGSQEIALRRGALLDFAPGPMTSSWISNVYEGVRCWDWPSEIAWGTHRRASPQPNDAGRWELRDYLPNRHADCHPVGLPSDDTQLAFWTLEQMLEDGGFVPENVAARFCSEPIFGIGQAVSDFIRIYRSGMCPWHRCAAQSAGNGSLMRIAPMLIPHLKTGTTNLWVNTALSAAITHNDSASISSCLAFVHILWHLLSMNASPSPEWWVATYVEAARDLETGKAYQPRGGDFEGRFAGSLWRFVEERLPDANSRGLSNLDACNSWYSGAYLLETVPSALYTLMHYACDPEEAIIRAVNDTRDNDTIAAIVGAAVGALHGRKSIPERWIEGLSGRTGATDDGRVMGLLDKARQTWWQKDTV